MDLFQFLLFLTALGVTGFFYFKYRKGYNRLEDLIADITSTNNDMRQTLAVGLYHRFRREEGKQEDPYKFEDFVAKVFTDYFGGTAVVTMELSNLV
ncbi:hypothetical protein P378_11625 [Desulforamulus profundi]|uniref:Uncharacterized protein n=1 Tax=Desulforamulus profundi TaxID=1383067 RepID=A0A2C6MEV7_9FIRM|nr:hypothetical protein [Desulforamulus profundi]PHJ38185.1 hypothetical protein P378_11625 [Desulforamulus profundi]